MPILGRQGLVSVVLLLYEIFLRSQLAGIALHTSMKNYLTLD